MGRGMVSGPNGVIAGPTPFMRGQFGMPGPAVAAVGGGPVPGPRVNASDIASQPSSGEKGFFVCFLFSISFSKYSFIACYLLMPTFFSSR